MSLTYLIVLLVSIFGLAVIDRKERLAFFASGLRATLSVVLSVALFLTWDSFGIALGIFFRGSSPFLTGVLLAPELPLEEIFFLILLSYCALLTVARILRGNK